jgi:hypothetical protein
MRPAVAIFLAFGFVLGLGLYGWIAVSSVRRHGFRKATRGATRAYLEELPLYWSVPWAAWTFLVALPIIAIWEIVDGDWDPVGAVSLALLWLGWFAMLRWHRRAKAGAAGPRHHSRGNVRS